MLRLLLVLACLAASFPALAGAFMEPTGYGQFIGGLTGSVATQRFSLGGVAQPTPAYRKIVASGFLEYGLAANLTLIAAPTLAHQAGVAANTVTGSDESAFGARLALFQAPDRVLAVQALVQPPLFPGSRADQLATGGDRDLAVDTRVMFAQSFTVRGMPAFVEVAPGARVRADPFPTEARLDVTVGLRPVPRVLLLLQSFGSLAPPAGPAKLIARTSYDKLQASLVYDVTPRWSVQLGAFRTVAGVDIVRETGPLGAVWFRF